MSDNVDTGKYRCYQFTWNNYGPDTEAYLKDMSFTYLLYGREVATTGTPHLQGMIYFKSQRAVKAVRKQLQGAHVEPARAPDALAKYNKKDGDYTELGTRPMTQQEKGQCNKDRYKRAWDAAVAGNLADIDPDIRLRHYSTLKRIRDDHQSKPPPLAVFDFHWFTGPSGSGKSRMAHEQNPDAYIKNPNKWWDGYTGQDCVIIDEWSPEHHVLASYLKKWADHHPFSAEYKGGTKCLRPKKLIITSNYTLDQCFERSADAEPLKRRFKVTTFSTPLDTLAGAAYQPTSLLSGPAAGAFSGFAEM